MSTQQYSEVFFKNMQHFRVSAAAVWNVSEQYLKDLSQSDQNWIRVKLCSIILFVWVILIILSKVDPKASQNREPGAVCTSAEVPLGNTPWRFLFFFPFHSVESNISADRLKLKCVFPLMETMIYHFQIFKPNRSSDAEKLLFYAFHKC